MIRVEKFLITEEPGPGQARPSMNFIGDQQGGRVGGKRYERRIPEFFAMDRSLRPGTVQGE